MRAREFLSELDTTGSDPSLSQNTTAQPSGNQDTTRLAAMVTGLQKQIQDLQKSALQTSAGVQPGMAPAPGAGNASQNPQQQQQQQQIGQSSQGSQGSTPQTITSQGPGQQTPAQPGMAATPVAPIQGLAGNRAPAPNAVPGVNQSPQVTNMKIKQQLAQNQGKGI